MGRKNVDDAWNQRRIYRVRTRNIVSHFIYRTITDCRDRPNYNDDIFFFLGRHSLALVSELAHFVVKVHLDLEDELQLLVGDEGGQGTVHLLARVGRLPVVLAVQIHFVAAGRLLVVVPPARAFLWSDASV